MTDIVLVTVVVCAALAASFTELLFRRGWPLLEQVVRHRLQMPPSATDPQSLRDELAALRQRLDQLERQRGQS